MLHIRELQPNDSISELTELLHRAYRPLALAGMRFVASHQDEATTLSRINKGICFVAELNGKVVGTIVYCRPGTLRGCPWYEQAHVAYFGQFAVEPDLQREGIGSTLLSSVEARARADGAGELALDTSIHAHHLIAYYSKRGYREVARVQWSTTNYPSVVLSKAIDA